MNLELKNSVIVISGGGAGIGQAISRACLAEGACVVILSRASQNVASFVDEMALTGQPCELIETHLGDMGQCKRAIDHVTVKYGRIDGLVNNAGVNDRIGLESGDPDRFMESIRQNLLHYYALAHYALPMLKESHGSILNISSKVALTGQGGTSAYVAAKGAQLALTREWAAELLPFGIRVNAILPADVMTPLYKSWLASLPEPERKLEQIKSRIPFGHRMTESSEIGAAAAFLLSAKQSGHTTAQHFVVDGGYIHLDRALT
jgi:L-fucose dehydrogenase